MSHRISPQPGIVTRYGWRCELCWLWSVEHYPTWDSAYCDYIDHQKWVDGR